MFKQELSSYLAPYGQEHLASFWDELSENERDRLLDDIKQVDFQELNDFFSHVKLETSSRVNEMSGAGGAMSPVPDELKGSWEKSSQQELHEYESQGLKAIANNEVAVLLLAGGQGTRLGVTYPKGMYSVDLLSGKSLYQLQAERLVKLKQLAAQRRNGAANQNQRHEGSIPLYIMGSEATLETTHEFFKAHDYFNLGEENVILFEQYMLPCLTNEGKVILDDRGKLSKAPDGNGGLYRALLKRGILDDMERRGVKYVHVYCVDNILVKIADPVFVGFCIQKQADCAAKVVRKTDPEEKVGVICRVADHFQVVEYTEISKVNRSLRDKNDDLVYNAGNICNHFFSKQFLDSVCRSHENELKHHVAHKKIPYVNENGLRVFPKDNNGIKLEKFVFDVFSFAKNFLIWEVPRDMEFSPLKNSDADKKETPTTCRNDLYDEHARWLANAGAMLVGEKEEMKFEISPLVSYHGEDLSELVSGRVLRGPLQIELHNDQVLFNGLDIEEYVKQ